MKDMRRSFDRSGTMDWTIIVPSAAPADLSHTVRNDSGHGPSSGPLKRTDWRALASVASSGPTL